MARALRLVPAAFAASLLASIASVSEPARAEAPNARATPVYVLSIWTDDADDQADALTQALRSRVRQANSWSLLETAQSFETLAIALKCPPKPDLPCLQRIGDQLHADHYIWGTMVKKRGGGEVTADLHLWSRGRPAAEVSESFSENLKDASDESLRTIAGRLFGKLAGTATGTLVVHAGKGAGAVLVDGVEKGSLEGGSARVEVAAGAHVVSVRVPGLEAPDQSTEVASGGDQEVSFALGPASRHAPAQENERSSSFPVIKVLGWSAVVAGAGFLVAGGIEGLNWINDSNTSSNDRSQVPKSVNDVCSYSSSAAQDACTKSKDAVSVSTLGWIFAGAGAVLVGTGIVLITTDHGPAETSSSAASRSLANTTTAVRLLPSVGPRAGSLQLRLDF
jgi:hypothetical protein